MKKSALAEGLKAAAQQPQVAATSSRLKTQPPVLASRAKSKLATPTVLIGGHFPQEVRRVLLLVQAEPANTGKNLKQLLGEAINDLCAKYRKPQPYTGEP